MNTYETRYENGYKVVTHKNIPMKHLRRPHKAAKPLFVHREMWYDQKAHEENDVWIHPPTESHAESFGELKEQIVLLFDDLMETPDSELGKLPTAWKQYLLEHIVAEEE